MNRRGFLQGILAAGAAPWVCTKAGVLMPVKQIVTPDYMTASEVWARQQEWLREATARVHAELRANPPLIDHGNGVFMRMLPPDRQWFTLDLLDTAPSRARAYLGEP